MILLLTFEKDGRLARSALELAGAARELATAAAMPITAAVFGPAPAGAAAELARYLPEVRAVAAEAFHPLRAEVAAGAAAEVARELGAKVVLAAATRSGLSFTPRLAVKLGAALLEDVISLEIVGGGLQAVRYSYLARVTETVRSRGLPVVVSVKPNVLAPARPAAAAGVVTTASYAPSSAQQRVRVGERAAARGGRVALEEAKIVVSGGRGLGDADGFRQAVEPLAEAIGAGVGATRAVVDAGWRPYSEQIGQTGKSVTPDIYIALGISGAVQHLSGMNRSKVVVAVNKDADAPIFKVADYGIVGDARQVAPAIAAAVKELLSS